MPSPLPPISSGALLPDTPQLLRCSTACLPLHLQFLTSKKRAQIKELAMRYVKMSQEQQ
jgi:hypothetical protein